MWRLAREPFGPESNAVLLVVPRTPPLGPPVGLAYDRESLLFASPLATDRKLATLSLVCSVLRVAAETGKRVR